jgi:hypothetical protein
MLPVYCTARVSLVLWLNVVGPEVELADTVIV